MKRIAILVVMLAGFGVVACGGSGGGGDNCPAAEASMLQAYQQFGALTEDPAIQACLTQAQTTCNCPGGGTAVANVAQNTLTLNSCKDANGNTFSGTFTFNSTMTSVSATVPTFGSCTNGTATDIQLNSCGGSISATCNATSVNCGIIDDPNSQQGCVLDCSC